MPGSPNISQKTIKPDPGITIKKEPSSPPKKDLKGSLESLRIGSSRLPSFRGPRDLTLSSLASSSSSSSLQPQSRPKRTFVPNIPVRRERGEKVIESRSEKSTKRVPNIVKHERGRGRGRGREKEFIQTKGSLFGEGIAASAVVKKSSDYGGSGGGREGAGGTKAGEMRMPYLNKDAASSFNKEYEARMLDEIKRDNLADDPDEESIPERDAPRVLPFIKLDEENKNIKKEDLKMEDNTMETTISNENKRLKIKQEPGLEPKMENNEKQTETSVEETNKFPKNSVAYSLLNKKENEFIYLQLPTCLPAYPPEELHQAAGSSTSSGTEARPEHDSNIQINTGFLKSSSPRCTLGTLPEGQIGNLRIYESGRVELCLGNHVLNVDKGVPVACLQDSVKITVDSENNTGSMSVLGHVKDRFVITPDFERIVKGLRNL